MKAFEDSQGMALLLLMVKSCLHVAGPALKLLANALDTRERAENVVAGGGLKTIFGIFMLQKGKVPKAAKCTGAGREVASDKGSKVRGLHTHVNKGGGGVNKWRHSSSRAVRDRLISLFARTSSRH